MFPKKATALLAGLFLVAGTGVAQAQVATNAAKSLSVAPAATVEGGSGESSAMAGVSVALPLALIVLALIVVGHIVTDEGSVSP